MSASDRITLTGLRVFGNHGVFEHERQDGQEFVIDVELELDLAPAVESDDVLSTVHYGLLAEAIAAAVGRDPVDLIETLAQRIVDVVLGFDLVARTTVTVHKPSAPIPLSFDDVAVTLIRGRPAIDEVAR
ncbi:dihydroneopterin aldolase [soil metagenome]